MAQHRGDTGIDLLERHEFGAVPHLVALAAGVGEQHRLEPALRTVLRAGLRTYVVERGEHLVELLDWCFFGAVERRFEARVGCHLICRFAT